MRRRPAAPTPARGCHARGPSPLRPRGSAQGAGAMLNAAAISGGVATTSRRRWLGQAARDLRQQVGVADQDIGAAVGQDVGDLLGLQMPVDRHHRAAQRSGSAGDLEQREIIAQHHGDRRAALQAERPQSRRRPGDAGVNLGIADAAVAADDHCCFLGPGHLFETSCLAMLFSPPSTRSCAWREGSGVGGSAAFTQASVPADRPPTPDLESELRSPRTPPLRGGGEQKIAPARVRWKALYLSSSISPKPTQLLPLKRRSRNCWNGR